MIIIKKYLKIIKYLGIFILIELFIAFILGLINLFGVTGIIPLTGVPLPFMSYGGSFAASIIVILTVIQRINYEENKKIQKKWPKI